MLDLVFIEQYFCLNIYYIFCNRNYMTNKNLDNNQHRIEFIFNFYVTFIVNIYVTFIVTMSSIIIRLDNLSMDGKTAVIIILRCILQKIYES